ncbi:hypothetical protein DL239_16420 [Sedimentitalea sp. CY04]|uniref:Methyltransferase FkbM domain-containing protein n=1 Tax=Parasedimentitalea denitrificans TaxID=2211118 RepID=A0ABX0WA59_9RHOB|nr:hypothetical protein [Sedimentitalea sp. CY04]
MNPINRFVQQSRIARYVADAANRKILNVALKVIRRHMAKQEGITLLKYDRKADALTPVIWRARGISKLAKGQALGATNNWPNLKEICDYSGKVVVDVGANCGATARSFANDASTVFAFEPHPGNYANLTDHIRIRKLEKIQTFQMALSSFNGETALIERESHGIHSLGPHNRGKEVSHIPIKVQKLDDFWKEHINEPIGLLKIDVEGFEAEVIEGAADLLGQKMIGAVLFEFSPRIHAIRGMDIDAPITLLREKGYEVHHADGRPFTLKQSEYPRVCDLIALPK